MQFGVKATGGQETTPTITANPQDKPKVLVIATLRKDGAAQAGDFRC
jgi:hypothetical protein